MFSKIHIGNEIRKRLNEMDLSVTWLADEIGCCNSNLTKKLSRSQMRYDLLMRISVALGHDFFALYSSEFHEIIKNK